MKVHRRVTVFSFFAVSLATTNGGVDRDMFRNVKAQRSACFPQSGVSTATRSDTLPPPSFFLPVPHLWYDIRLGCFLSTALRRRRGKKAGGHSCRARFRWRWWWRPLEWRFLRRVGRSIPSRLSGEALGPFFAGGWVLCAVWLVRKIRSMLACFEAASET